MKSEAIIILILKNEIKHLHKANVGISDFLTINLKL